jgi:hypothetical protein
VTRDLTPLLAADLSTFAKTLRLQLAERLERGAGLPGHVEMLNLLARAAGHRNVQALRAQAAQALGAPAAQALGAQAALEMKAAAARTPSPTPAAAAPPRWHGPRQAGLTPLADRVLRAFDTRARLLRWPGRRAEQVLALWCLWMPFDGKRRYSECEVNELLNAHHAFGDHCLLRRELVEVKLLARTPGGAQYRKLAARPSEETAALLRAVRARAAG